MDVLGIIVAALFADNFILVKFWESARFWAFPKRQVPPSVWDLR